MQQAELTANFPDFFVWCKDVLSGEWVSLLDIAACSKHLTGK
jgi:hypothetical protein